MIKDKAIDFKGVTENIPVIDILGGDITRISEAGMSLTAKCADCPGAKIPPPDIKDSGGRTEFKTGAVRDAQGGKGRFDLLPKMAIWALAHHYEKGCEKYGDRNWEKGIPIKNFIDSGTRHITEFELGLDDENHLIAAAWNLLCAYETLLRIDLGLLPGDLDDLSYPLKGRVVGSEEVQPWDRFKNFHKPEVRTSGGG